MANQSFRVKNSIEVGSGVTITSGGNITAGVLTATSFVGSGSQLTGIIASSGIATYAFVSGVSTSVVGGAASVTYLTVSGISTFYNTVNIRNGYNLNVGDNNDLRIYNDGTDSRIEETGSGSLKIFASDINIFQHSTNKRFANFIGSGAAELYYNDSRKISTSGVGATITGTLDVNQLNVSGISTFAGITTVTGDTLFTKQVNVSGVSTFVGNINVGSAVTVYASSGIVSAISFRGDGSALTGIAATTNVRTNSLVVSGVSTFSTGPVLISSTGTATSTGTVSQPLQVTGDTYISGNTGIGTTIASLKLHVVGDVKITGIFTDSFGSLRSIPQNSQTSAYVLVANDNGRHISITTGGVTVPQNIFSVGDTVAIYNNSGSSQTITQGTGVTLRLSGTSTTGNRTLDQYGLCTILCVSSNTFVISGSGLT